MAYLYNMKLKQCKKKQLQKQQIYSNLLKTSSFIDFLKQTWSVETNMILELYQTTYSTWDFFMQQNATKATDG